MQNLGAKNQYQLWRKIDTLFRELLTEESVLNYPVKELTDKFLRSLKKWLKNLEEYWNRLENENWVEEIEELEKYAQESFSKTTVLVAANILIFIWMIGSGVFAKVLPSQLNIYVASALGAEADEIGFPQGLKLQNNNVLEPRADPGNNSLSEAKCERDKEEYNCSELCADINIEQDLISKMNEEERRIWEKNHPKTKIPSQGQTGIKRGPMPYVFKVMAGRRICNRKNDHPAKSKKGKGRHMDMECCLDPDETPNPNCYYSSEKYGKYL